MTIEELFAIINAAWSENTLSLSAERFPGTPVAAAIKGHFENGLMILHNASKPEIREGAVVIQSAKPDKMFTLRKASTCSAVWKTDGSSVSMNVILVPDGQSERGLSLVELYPQLAAVYLKNYRFANISLEIDSTISPVEFEPLQEKYAEGLFHPAAGTFYSSQLKLTATLLWPAQLLPLQDIFGKDRFSATGHFQLVNGMMRYFITVNGTNIKLGQLNIATNLELLGLLLDSVDGPAPDTQPEADAMQIFAGIFSLPGELATNTSFRFETFWQVAVPETLTIRSTSIVNVKGALKDFSKALLGIDLPEWPEIPGLPLLSTFSLEGIEIVFDRKKLALISCKTRFSLLDQANKFTLIENLLTLDKIGIEIGFVMTDKTPSFYGTVSGRLTLNGTSVFVTELNLPACSFLIGLDEFSSFDAGALIRRAVPLLPESIPLVAGDLMLTGNVRARSCSFELGMEPGSSIDFFLFTLDSFYFFFDYSNGDFSSSSFAGASAEIAVSLGITENLSIGLRGYVDSDGWVLEGSMQVEEKVFLTDFLPKGLGLPPEIGGFSFKSAEVILKRGKESGVSFTILEPLSLSFGDVGNMAIEKLALLYTSTKEGYEWEIICGGKIELVKENPTDKPWLIHGKGELSITKNKDGLVMSFLSEEGITVERLPLLIPYKITTSGIEWSEVKFTLKEITLGKKSDGWYFDSAFLLKKVKLPSPIDDFFPEKGIDVKFSIKQKTVSLTIVDSFIDYKIPAITIPKVGDIPEFNLGASRIIFGDLTLTVGKKTGVECSLKYWMPERSNYLFGTDQQGNPKLKLFDTYNPAAPDTGKTVKVTFFARLTDEKAGPKIGATVSELPLLPLEKKGEYYLFNLGPKKTGEEYGMYGCLKFKMPEFAFDLKKGGFTIGADFGIEKMLAIPLGPFKTMLANGAMKDWAKRLPDALPIPFPFNPEIFKDNKLNVEKAKSFYQTMMGSPLPDEAVVWLDKLAGVAKNLPNGFKQYLSLNDPEGKFELKFKLTISPKGSLDIALTANPGLKILSLNPPLSVQGMVLRSFSFGTLLGGQLFSTRIDADFEQFDVAQLFASVALPEEAYYYLGTPENFGTKITIQELFIIIIYQTYIPIPVPIFYKKLGIDYYGLGDFGFKGAISFPEPNLNILEIAGLVSDLVQFLSKKEFELDPDKVYEDFDLRFILEPTYVKTPKVLGEHKYGRLTEWTPPSLYKTFAIILNSIKFFKLDYAINIIPIEERFRIGDKNVPVRLSCLSLPKVDWVLSTPVEFIEMAHKKLGLDAAQANQWLSIVPGPADNVPVKPTDKGVIAYFRGSWETTYADFESVFGLIALSVNQFRAGLRVRGRVSKLFDFEAYAFANVKPTDPYFFIYGESKTTIMLIGLQIFEGQTHVMMVKNHFTADGVFYILNENALFYLRGSYGGEFDSSRLNLKGGLSGKFLVFELEGDGRIANDGIGGMIGIKGRQRSGFDITISGSMIQLMLSLDLPWATFQSTVGLIPDLTNPVLDLYMKSSSIAGLIGLEIKFHCKAFDIKFQGDFFLSLFGNRVLSGWAKIDGANLSAGGKLFFSLIPGTSIDVNVSGHIGNTGFSLTGDGTLNVTGLPGSGINLTVSNNGISGKVTILGVEYGLGIVSCSGKAIIILRALNITSFIDDNGFHFKKDPPCWGTFASAVKEKTEPCRVNESSDIFFESMLFVHKSQKKITAIRSASFTKIAGKRNPDYTLDLFAARKKTGKGKTAVHTKLVLHPKGNQVKLVREIKKEIQLLARSKGKDVKPDFSGVYFELERDLSANKPGGTFTMFIPEGTTAKTKHISYKFKGLFPGHEFLQLVAEKIVAEEAKIKTGTKKDKLKNVSAPKKKASAGNKKKVEKQPVKKSSAVKKKAVTPKAKTKNLKPVKKKKIVPVKKKKK